MHVGVFLFVYVCVCVCACVCVCLGFITFCSLIHSLRYMAFCPLDLAEQTPLLFLAMLTDLPTYFSTGAQERGWQPLGFGCNTDWKLRSSCSSLTAASVAALRRIQALSSLLGAREIKMVAGNYLSEPVLHHRQQGANVLSLVFPHPNVEDHWAVDHRWAHSGNL